jgi:anthranilate synthase/aminodeoxychorismate synthase-like glutamine amidotransferase
MVLMIDNYDSFTYNLVQYLGYLGAEVKVVRNDHITIDEIERLEPERIMISPGPCTPNEAGVSLALIGRFSGRIPILGVCLGHQAIGQAFGGRIVRPIVSRSPPGPRPQAVSAMRSWVSATRNTRSRASSFIPSLS